MAAQTYFGRSASELDPAQAATLVGMLKGSYRYNPVRHPERALERRNVVLAQMVKRGVLDEREYARLKARPLGLDFRRPEDGEIGQARHFVEHMRERIIDWADQRDLDLDRDGLVIHTTLDSRLQQAAQQAVARQMADLQRLAGREWSQARLVSGKPEAGRGASSRSRISGRRHPDLAEQVLRDSPQFAAARQSGLGEREALARLQADAALVQRLRDERTRLSAGFIAIDPDQRRGPGLGRQPGFRQRPVRPCGAGAAPAGVDLQALRLRRGDRQGHFDRPDLPRRRGRDRPRSAARSGVRPTWAARAACR